MTDARAAAIGGISLLERAINYLLGSLHLVTSDDLARPTPCRDWTVRDLLHHLDDSLLALDEAVGTGRIELATPSGSGAADPVVTVRDHARHLLAAWSGNGTDRLISIAGCALTAGIVTGTGALELTVHGWDLAQACGWPREIPGALAEELLDLSPLFIVDADRPRRFAAPVPVPAEAGVGDRLLAFLGRDPAPAPRPVRYQA